MEFQNKSRTQPSTTCYGKPYYLKKMYCMLKLAENRLTSFRKTCWRRVLKNMEIHKFNFLRTKQIQRNFCTCHLAFSSGYTYNKRTTKGPIIKNKACINHTPKLDMVSGLGTCACDRTPFTARPGFSLLDFKQPKTTAFIYSKLTIETLEQGRKYVQS